MDGGLLAVLEVGQGGLVVLLNDHHDLIRVALLEALDALHPFLERVSLLVWFDHAQLYIIHLQPITPVV